MPITIQQHGNQFAIVFDDGSKVMAYPTMGGSWFCRELAVMIHTYYGNLLLLTGSGVSQFAYPTTGGVWFTQGDLGPTPPDPPPIDPPAPGGNGFSWPFNPNTTVSSEYGPRTGGVGTFHEGIDFGLGGVKLGSTILATNQGTIQTVGWHVNFGNWCIIHHGTIDNRDYKTLHAHMRNPAAWSVGNHINKAAVVGFVNNTGAASHGSHLHWEVHQCRVGGNIIWNTRNNGNPRTAINARDFMKSYGDGVVLNTHP